MPLVVLAVRPACMPLPLRTVGLAVLLRLSATVCVIDWLVVGWLFSATVCVRAELKSGALASSTVSSWVALQRRSGGTAGTGSDECDDDVESEVAADDDEDPEERA